MRMSLVACVLLSCILVAGWADSSAQAGHGHCRGGYSPGGTYSPGAPYAPTTAYTPSYYTPSYYTAPTYYAPTYYAPVATYAAPTYYVPAASYAPSYAPAYAPGAPSSTCAGQGPGGPSPPSAGTPSFLAAIADFRAVLQLLQEFRGGGGGGDGQIDARLTAIEKDIADLKRDVQALKAAVTKDVPPIPKSK